MRAHFPEQRLLIELLSVKLKDLEVESDAAKLISDHSSSDAEDTDIEE